MIYTFVAIPTSFQIVQPSVGWKRICSNQYKQKNNEIHTQKKLGCPKNFFPS